MRLGSLSPAVGAKLSEICIHVSDRRSEDYRTRRSLRRRRGDDMPEGIPEHDLVDGLHPSAQTEFVNASSA